MANHTVHGIIPEEFLVPFIQPDAVRSAAAKNMNTQTFYDTLHNINYTVPV